MRPIDADALKLYIDKEVEKGKVLDGWAFFFKVYLDNAPVIDIDRPQGEWVMVEHPYYETRFKCSNCGESVPWDYEHSIDLVDKYRTCPFCDARMKGADDE